MDRKHLLLIGTAGLDDLLVKEDTQGRLTSLRYFRGILLIERLLDHIQQHGEAVDSQPLILSMDVPVHVSSATCLAQRDASGAITDVHELGHYEPRSWPPSKVRSEDHSADFQIVFDVDATGSERRGWVKPTQRISATGWTVIHAQNADRLRTITERFGPDRKSRTLVVVEAEDLRRHGVRLSKGRSWDRSYLDLLAYMADEGTACFSVADHVLVRFGAEAVVHACRSPKGATIIVAHHLPGAEEGEAGSPLGPKADIGIFLSRLVLELSRASLPHTAATGGSEWIDDHRTTEQRIPFAIRQAMRTVLGALRSGWTDRKGEVGLPPELFTCAAVREERIASIDIGDLDSVPSLLHLATHAYPGTLDAWAVNYVRTGETGLLGAAPLVEFGALLLADRGEIEQYRDVRDKVLRYVAKPGDKPLSIGVFGPPGSGKTFGVEQMKDALGDAVIWMPKNIGSYRSEAELLNVWQAIRDENLRGHLPFVLLDEFDSMLYGVPYGWFQHYLQPTNEGKFDDGTSEHPLGHGIFVFTGGTCHSYAEFRRKSRGGEPVDRAAEDLARERKMPDMARRLQEHIDVKGISYRPGDANNLHLVRRAIVLRKEFIGKDPKNRMKPVDIELDLLAALLHLPEYHNGTSSMCKLVGGWKRSRDGRFTKATMPEDSTLENFLDPVKFKALMEQNDHLQDVIEPLARMIHADWRVKQDPAGQKEADVPWEELKEHYRDSNRMQAMDMVRKLDAMGYRCVPAQADAPLVSFTDDEVEHMARMEHDRWMKEKMAAGWTYGPDRNNALKIHPLLVPYDRLDEPAKEMDRDPVRRIPEWLGRVGFGVEKKAQ